MIHPTRYDVGREVYYLPTAAHRALKDEDKQTGRIVSFNGGDTVCVLLVHSRANMQIGCRYLYWKSP